MSCIQLFFYQSMLSAWQVPPSLKVTPEPKIARGASTSNLENPSTTGSSGVAPKNLMEQFDEMSLPEKFTALTLEDEGGKQINLLSFGILLHVSTNSVLIQCPAVQASRSRCLLEQHVQICKIRFHWNWNPDFIVYKLQPPVSSSLALWGICHASCRDRWGANLGPNKCGSSGEFVIANQCGSPIFTVGSASMIQHFYWKFRYVHYYHNICETCIHAWMTQHLCDIRSRASRLWTQRNWSWSKSW